MPACRKLLARLGLSIADFDLIEINEAFAVQVIASMRALGLDPAAPHLNPHGGAIALGHPLGMSGARLAMTAVHGLEEMNGRRAMVDKGVYLHPDVVRVPFVVKPVGAPPNLEIHSL